MGVGHLKSAEICSKIDANAFQGILIILSSEICFSLNSEKWGY